MRHKGIRPVILTLLIVGLGLPIACSSNHSITTTDTTVPTSTSSTTLSVTTVSILPSWTPQPPPGAVIVLMEAGFSPQFLTVPVGSTVTWVHIDEAEDTAWWWHSATSETSVFDSGVMYLDDTFSYTFSEPGTYYYNCEHHAIKYFRAAIIVE